MESHERIHPWMACRRISLCGGELVDARADDVDRQLVDLAERTRKGTGEIRHPRARVGLDEIRIIAGACVEHPEVEHLLVLVTKGTQVGNAQRC